MDNLIKVLSILAITAVSFNTSATESLNGSNKAHMQHLGKAYACELYFADIGQQRKSDIISIATAEEFEADWNIMRNDTMIEAMTDHLYSLSRGNQKHAEGCNTLYTRILSYL